MSMGAGMECLGAGLSVAHLAIHTCLRECHTLVAPFEIAVAILNLRVDPAVLVGIVLLMVAAWILLRRR